MTEISQIIYQFRTFIIRCWPSIIELDEAENDCTMSFEENCIEVLWEQWKGINYDMKKQIVEHSIIKDSIDIKKRNQYVEIIYF